MATIKITDTMGLTGDLNIRNDSPLVKAGLTEIVSSVNRFAGNLTRPIGQTDIRKVVFGATLAAPSTLIGGAASLGVTGGANGAITIYTNADGELFGGDPFAPAIPIAGDQCWVQLEIDASLGAGISGAIDGFGVGVNAGAQLSLSTYSLVNASDSLAGGLEATFENYGVAVTAEKVRTQPVGTVRAAELGGTLTFSGSYSLPISVNALATADLPFNYKINVVPSSTLEVAGQIALTGDFVIRSYKVSDTEVRLGVYKMKGTTLSASLLAGVGVRADLGNTNLTDALFGAVMPKIDPAKAGIPADAAARLKSVANDAINRSLSIAVNVECAASKTDEAAVVYSIDLAGGDPSATDSAIASALRGDWTALDGLPNARALRNIVRDTKEHRHKLAISLLGLYNAASVESFVQQCTVLRDENGQIVITDQATASRISTVSTPLLADADKLRAAMAEAFLATVTYTASAGTKLNANLSVSQTYLRYKDSMTRQEMQDAVLLSRALGRDMSLDASPSFRHARIAAGVQYDTAAALRLFFADVPSRTSRSTGELERTGRDSMLALIDPGDPAGTARRRALADDRAWSAMQEIGNTAQFGTIAGLSGLSFTELNAVGVDYLDVVWWAESMSQVAPALAEMLDAVASSDAADPTQDADFMQKRDKLVHLLSSVTRNTHAAFTGGWGLAVMFALSGETAQPSVEIVWDGKPAALVAAR